MCVLKYFVDEGTVIDPAPDDSTQRATWIANLRGYSKFASAAFSKFIEREMPLLGKRASTSQYVSSAFKRLTDIPIDKLPGHQAEDNVTRHIPGFIFTSIHEKDFQAKKRRQIDKAPRRSKTVGRKHNSSNADGTDPAEAEDDELDDDDGNDDE